MASDTVAELGRLFENCQKATSMKTSLAKKWQLTTTNTSSIEQYSNKHHYQRTGRKKTHRNKNEILLVQRNNMTKSFPHILGEGGKKLAVYVTKHHTIWHQRKMRPIYLKAKKAIKNSKYRENGTRRGCAGTINPGVTQKPENQLNRIRDPISRNPDNTLEEIRNLIPNRIWS